MLVADQKITEHYAIYNGDCCEVLPGIRSESVHLSIYSPPFATKGGGALYHYSSSDSASAWNSSSKFSSRQIQVTT